MFLKSTVPSKTGLVLLVTGATVKAVMDSRLQFYHYQDFN